MHCKKIRTEYMKRFRDPQWSQFGQCYLELLRYRLSRRLLEQSHNPWLWPSEEASSDCSSDRRSPQQEDPPFPAQITEVDVQSQPSAELAVPNRSNAEPHICGSDCELGVALVEKGSKPPDINEKNKSVNPLRPPHGHKALSRRSGSRKLVGSPERTVPSREIRHPFALYAAGEKKKDTGSQKTHNVCAPTSANEIHDSALRAKNRRQKEKRKQLLQKQRSQTADVERNLMRKTSQSENPWLTEYMRCYSARTR
ncbi:centriole, cilia and spindle-associated protein [Pleurodeles waltl]|uniref:centriole, cilia and spindle-associated protein n=1 Tax=Pleurodeles waltl TaxID=8319 RepID=UPI0037099C6C